MVTSNHSARILIVDDTPKNIQVLGTILRQEGYQINIAQDGLKAIQMAEKVSPDLVLLDVMMPDMDGYETCQRLKQSPETKDIPIIFLTARKEPEDIVKGFEVGGVDYISKPFNSIELLARIRTHLDLWYKTRQLQSIADKDGLTMIANRRRFDAFFDLEWRRGKRDQTPITIIMIDIDYFKAYNDYYGHLQGDECLKQIAKVIDINCRRPGDIAARYGGEEFAAILGNTDQKGGIQHAEKIRRKVEGLGIHHEKSHISDYVTVSLGIATMIPSKEDGAEQLMKIADEQLYRAKELGRNQVCVAEDSF